MATYYVMLSLHVLGATVWAGGHIVLALTILPQALKQGRAVIVSEYEQRFERIGLPWPGGELVRRLIGGPRCAGETRVAGADRWARSSRALASDPKVVR